MAMFGAKFLDKINKSDKKSQDAFLHDAKNTFSCDAFESDSFLEWCLFDV